jgi:hypothetical protein
VVTDTASYSHLVFGLPQPLGFQYRQALADIPDQRLWRVNGHADYGPLGVAARGRLDFGPPVRIEPTTRSQDAWLRREKTFSDLNLPLDQLIGRYLHDALTDPRPLRLLLWRGLTDPDQAPPDASPKQEDLTSIRRRQQDGELPADIEPAMLRLLLLAAVTAPVAFPDTTRRLFGTAPDDPDFEQRYLTGLNRLLAHLATPPTQ